MARPKINPMLRFADVAQTMNYVVDHGSFELECETVNAAINQLQRFNQYRKIIRENNEGLTVLDNFIFARRGTVISVYRRPHINPDMLREPGTGRSLGQHFREWEAADREKFLQQHGVFTTPQSPSGHATPRYNDDHNPAAPDKPLKLDD